MSEPPASRGAARIGAGDVERIIKLLNDPIRLRRVLATLGRAVPGMNLPGAEQVEADLMEGLRRARAVTRNPSEAMVRRHRILELLIVERMTPDQVIEAQFISRRTYYRYRQEALTELALSLDALWRERSHATVAPAAPAQSTPATAEGIPHPRHFMGRERELRQAQQLLPESRLLVVGGPAGIGKTSFGATLARHLAAVRPVVWHRFRPGLTDSVGGVLFAIGQQLRELGSPALLSFLAQVTAASPWEAVAHGIAVHSVQERGLAMLFDDGDVVADNAPVIGLLSSLHSDCPSAWVVVMARERMSRLDGATRMELLGLDGEAVRTCLTEHGLGDLSGDTVGVIAEQTGGNPHLLHLATGALLHGELDPVRLREQILDVPDIQTFFFEQIYSRLTEPQRMVLNAASLMRQPATLAFLAAALEGLAPSIPTTLGELGRRFLMSATTDGLRLHSSVREFTRRALAPEERMRGHRRLARAYTRMGQYDEACHHWLEAGDVERARDAILASGSSGAQPPHVQARMLALVQRLQAAGLDEDPQLARLAVELTARIPVSRRSRLPRPGEGPG